MKVIAIGGVPAVGKTTIMKEFMKQSDYPWVEWNASKLMPSLICSTLKTAVLGRYDDSEPFGGTDRFSMAVQPEAEEFFRKKAGPMRVVFEGDRLFNSTMLEFLANEPGIELQILLITADEKLIEDRHVFRKDTQSDVFKKGRETKYNNIRSNFLLMDYITVFENNTKDDLNLIVDHLWETL